MAHPLMWLAGAALGWTGYKLGIETPPRFLGDLAKPGDGVQESVEAFLPQNSMSTSPQISSALSAAAIGGFVSMKVEKTTKDDLFGPLVTTGGKEMRPADFGMPATGAFRMARNSITMINRGGKVATKFTVPGLAERLTKSHSSQGATFAGSYPFDREYRLGQFGAARNTRAFKG